MSKPLIILVSLIYLGISIDSAMHKNWGISIAYLGYAFANVGLAMLV